MDVIEKDTLQGRPEVSAHSFPGSMLTECGGRKWLSPCYSSSFFFMFLNLRTTPVTQLFSEVKLKRQLSFHPALLGLLMCSRFSSYVRRWRSFQRHVGDPRKEEVSRDFCTEGTTNKSARGVTGCFGLKLIRKLSHKPKEFDSKKTVPSF